MLPSLPSFERVAERLAHDLGGWSDAAGDVLAGFSQVASDYPVPQICLCAAIMASAFASSYLMQGITLFRIPRAWKESAQAASGRLRGALFWLQRLSDPDPIPQLVADLPEMLDIVNLGLTAGLSFDASLHEYCVQREGALAKKMSEVQLKWQMGVGTRQEMLSELAREMDEPSFTRFATAVNDSLEMGTPLTQTLSRQARLAREEQRAAVEERIERAPVKMLVPMGSLVVPAMLLAIVGPLVAAIAE